MQITDFLKPALIRHSVVASSKKRALEVVGQVCADYFTPHATEEDDTFCAVACFERLVKREKLGSTALNNGIALPHAKLSCQNAAFDKPIAVFLQLETPVDYGAADNREVDLIFAMLFPEDSCEKYKAALPELAQKLSDKTLLKQLRLAHSDEEIWQIFKRLDEKGQETQP